MSTIRSKISSAKGSSVRAQQLHTPFKAEALPTLLLGLLVFALTTLFYATAYEARVFAHDRIRGLFVGFQDLEGEALGEPYRWTKGDATVCLPALGSQRPLADLELRLLGSAVTGGTTGRPIDRAVLRVGSVGLPLAIAPESRTYHLLLPPAPDGGPVCLNFVSATVDPQGNGRVVGVGLRSATLERIAPGALPPLGQLGVNLALAVGSYALLRRVGLPRLAALALLLAMIAAIGAGLIGGALRFAPDLPFWSGFWATALGLILGALVSYQWATPRCALWQCELLGAGLVLGLLASGWYALAHLEGYIWPFPLMARGGTAFGWGVLPAAMLFVAFVAVNLHWLRAASSPPAWLAVGVSAVAGVALPVALKVGLRGWSSLFQTFVEQEGDYIRDVPRVGTDPLGFLRGYVEAMPELVLHNKTHPPGSTLFLWLVERIIGPGPEPAAWVVIGIAALGVVPTYVLTKALLGARTATLAAAVYVVLPAYLIYAATSMDALFATLLACATTALYSAILVPDEPGTRLAPHLLVAVAAGVWVAFGLFFTFTTLMLALIVLALVLYRLRVSRRPGLSFQRLVAVCAVIGGTVLLVLALLWAATGYNTLAAFFVGVANNRVDVLARVSPLGLSSYLFFLAVNAVAFCWFLGPWAGFRLVRSGGAQVARASTGVERKGDALGVGMAALIGGMLASGLFFREIERVWLFAHILIAAVLANGIMEQADRRSRVLLAAALLVALFVHGIVFRAALRVAW